MFQWRVPNTYLTIHLDSGERLYSVILFLHFTLSCIAPAYTDFFSRHLSRVIATSAVQMPLSHLNFGLLLVVWSLQLPVLLHDKWYFISPFL